jgi:hypothetical protein
MSDELLVRIEVPKGSRNKYEVDERTDANRSLFSSVVYPTKETSPSHAPRGATRSRPLSVVAFSERGSMARGAGGDGA